MCPYVTPASQKKASVVLYPSPHSSLSQGLSLNMGQEASKYQWPSRLCSPCSPVYVWCPACYKSPEVWTWVFIIAQWVMLLQSSILEAIIFTQYVDLMTEMSTVSTSRLTWKPCHFFFFKKSTKSRVSNHTSLRMIPEWQNLATSCLAGMALGRYPICLSVFTSPVQTSLSRIPWIHIFPQIYQLNAL